MNTSQNRRDFLKFLSVQSATIGLSPLLASSLTSCANAPKGSSTIVGLKATREDQLKLAPGLNYEVLCRWGDTFSSTGQKFGFNNDFTAYMPFKTNPNEGFLWVNHEAVIPQFVHNKNTSQLTRSINEIIKEQELVGGSILHIKKENNKWVKQLRSKYNRRVDGRTTIPFSHNSVIQGKKYAVGTLANCSGGITPWGTFLTSEENYDGFYGEAYLVKGKRSVRQINNYNWSKQFPLPPEHYGWVVEINPLTGYAEKQILLGRAPHEGAKLVQNGSKNVVVYMGEDREGGFIFKFVSDGMNFKSGTLYAADTIKGKWLPLDLEKSPILKTNFKTQLEVLTYAHQSAEMVGATPQDRPEGIEVNDKTGDIFIALTKNKKQGNLYGSLLKISESGNYNSTTFQSDTWVSGGLESGMACPDNLCFDNKGHLWVTTDMAEKDMFKKEYQAFGNNGLYCIPTYGPQAGQPILMASAPVDAELTGPSFSPDYKTLFLSVQHPGSRTRFDMSRPTSTWPDGPGQLPKSAVVTIQGPLLERLMS